MTTVIFVHGTGVRASRYVAQFDRVRANILARRPDAVVLPCAWGDRLGASLSRGGESIPVDMSHSSNRSGRDSEAAGASDIWALLDIDPLQELRLTTALADGRERSFVIGEEPAGPRLAAVGMRLVDTQSVRAQLLDLGLLECFSAAVEAVLGSPVTQSALRYGSEEDLPEALARAFVAETLRRSSESPQGYVPVTAARREHLVSLITEQLGGLGLGLVSASGKVLSRLAVRWAASRVTDRRRAALTDAAHPMAGDIMLYLARGERIRAFIEECCRGVSGPITLLAHSLGGVACVDLLVLRDIPEVRSLVTVGSQAPFLYELGALPSLDAGEPLPDRLPAWTNFYDPRDLLAYVGAEVFAGRVVDVPVASGNPFPFAHSDYFGNPDFYDRLEGALA